MGFVISFFIFLIPIILCWGYKGNETMGIGYSDKSDRYWDMYQSLRKARYDMVFDDEEREEMKHTVMAYSPMNVSSKPLIQVIEKNGTSKNETKKN